VTIPAPLDAPALDEPLRAIDTAPCYCCGSRRGVPVSADWWGIGVPALFAHVRCVDCPTCYNAYSGQSNAGLIAMVLASYAVVFLGALAFVLLSNVTLDAGRAEFAPRAGEQTGGELHVAGPPGSQVIVYAVVPGLFGELALGSGSIHELPLVGEHTHGSDWFPAEGGPGQVALEQHVRLLETTPPTGLPAPRDPEKAARLGTYLLITQDRTWTVERLRREAPALLEPRSQRRR
jgi:hypothetical protein